MADYRVASVSNIPAEEPRLELGGVLYEVVDGKEIRIGEFTRAKLARTMRNALEYEQSQREAEERLSRILPERWLKSAENLRASSGAVENLVIKANSALLVANAGAELRLDDADSARLFQQAELLFGFALENLYKGVLAARRIELILTHDIAKLAKAAQIEHLDERMVKYLAELSVLTELGRYPETQAGIRNSGYTVAKAALKDTIWTYSKHAYDEAIKSWKPPRASARRQKPL